MQPNQNCPQTMGVSISGGLSSSTLKKPYMVPDFQFLVSLGRISFTWYNTTILEFCFAQWCVNEIFCALQYQSGIIQGSQKALHGTRFSISSFTWWNSYRLVKKHNLEFCFAHWCMNEFFCALQYQSGITQGSQKPLHGTRFPISSLTW